MVRIYWKKRAIQFTNDKGDREDIYVRRGSSFGYFSKSVCCEKRREQPLQRAAEKLAAKFENTGSKVNGIASLHALETYTKHGLRSPTALNEERRGFGHQIHRGQGSCAEVWPGNGRSVLAVRRDC